MPSSDMDVDRPKSREDIILTENTDDFIIGDRVWVNGTKPGYIQYLGETRFGQGEWAGVVLDDHSGKNDGSVAGVRYFQCEPKRGVFARLHKLTRYPLLHATPPATKLLDAPTPPPVQRCLTPTRTPSPGARNLKEGDRVTVSSSSGPPKTGVLRYLGHTDFAAGEWAGIELDEPIGKNDGTVAGKRYFKCSPHHGLFSPAHKVTKMTGSLDRHRRTHNSDSDREEKESNNKQGTQNLQDDRRRYAEESEKRVLRLRQLLEAAETERKQLAVKLEEERRKVEELEFRIEEESIGKDDLEAEREKARQTIENLERRLEQEVRKNEMMSGGATPDSILKQETQSLNEEIERLREKLREAEHKIKELQTIRQAPPPSTYHRADELTRKEEALLQAQLSLDNKKREVQNLLGRITELEKDLEKSKARQSRQLDTIDELNIKLQKSDSKCSSLEEELDTVKEKNEELDRRLRLMGERVSHLEAEKKKLEEQLVSPESAPEADTLQARLQDRERELEGWRREAEAARTEVDRLREDRERTRKEFEDRIRRLNEEHLEEVMRQKKQTEEVESRSESRLRHLEKELQQVRTDLESARAEAETTLSWREAKLQESMLAVANQNRLREDMNQLQMERDRLKTEKEQSLKQLTTLEQERCRWESEATKASNEVNLLKSQVQHLRTEFANHRDDLVKKLAETQFDAKMVQDMHSQIEEQRRLVENMQKRLKWTEDERNQLQTTLVTKQQDQAQVENCLRQEVETLKRRLSESEAERKAIQRSLEASQLLNEERSASQQQQQVQNNEYYEKEKSLLEQKIVDLQVELASIRNGRPDPDSEYENMRREKEALDQQVHFLNSVIVDMQHKNDDLRSRLDILETEVIFDGQLNLSMPHRRATSRLFCDICDAFDLHDTEDCPKQNSVRRTLSYSSQESEF